MIPAIVECCWTMMRIVWVGELKMANWFSNIIAPEEQEYIASYAGTRIGGEFILVFESW